MGGASCMVIIRAKLKELFSDPAVYEEIAEVPFWKRHVDHLLAKEYNTWTDLDFMNGLSIYAQLYVKLKHEYE